MAPARKRMLMDVIYELNKFDNPDDIAGLLRRNKITGLRGNTKRCPVANYIKQQTGMRNITVDIKIHGVQVKPAAGFNRNSALAEFIEDFDEGLFPELDEYPSEKDRDPESWWLDIP